MQFENSNCKKTPFHSSYLRIPTRIVIRGTLFCKHDYTVLCSLLSNTFLCVFSNTHFFVFAQLALLHLLHDVNTINMWTITLFTSRNHTHSFSKSFRHNQVASNYQRRNELFNHFGYPTPSLSTSSPVSILVIHYIVLS